MRRFLLFFTLACLIPLIAVPAAAERRVALVIGNGAYGASPLKNPPNDAHDVASVLNRLGFEVILKENATRRAMNDAIDQFWDSLKKGGTGLFFFAGHGVQVAGENYLVPVDANIRVERDVFDECVSANRVLGRMENAGNGMNIIILDACRNNPFARNFRSVERGLAKMDAPSGSLVAFATAPGDVASDGSGRNGLYTSHLLKHLSAPGLKIEDVLKQVRIGVSADSAKQGKKQTPWESSSLMGDFYFAGSSGSQLASFGPLGPVGTGGGAPKGDPIAQVPSPSSAGVSFEDIESKAKASAKAEAEAKAKWGAWQKNMAAAVGKAQTLERNSGISAEDKAQAWQRVAEAYAEKNPFSEEDTKLRQKVQVQMEHWRNEARKKAEAQSQQQQALAQASGQQPQVSTSAPANPAAQSWREPTTGMEFVWVPGGCYKMGAPFFEVLRLSSDEGPEHEVCISGLWVGKYPVTNAEYRRFKADHSSGLYRGQQLNAEKQPAVQVSWEDAKAYSQWLSAKGKYQFRLPTEAEFEYAIRSGSTTARYWGNGEGDACQYANVHDEAARLLQFDSLKHECDDGYSVTSPIGTYPANAFGLYDMLGNVSQWCEDVYVKDAYSSHAKDNPVTATGGISRVIRGASFVSSPSFVRSAYRYKSSPATQAVNIGFRLVRAN